MANHVVVTGVSSGIGHGIAADLLKRGYIVFGSVRSEQDGSRLENEFGTNFIPLVFDVTDPDALGIAVEKVKSIIGDGELVALINNAGINLTGPLMHLPVEEIRGLFEVNVFGVIRVTQAFLPLLGARIPASQTPGRIINISSVSGGIVVPFLGAYAASKHALEAITLAFRRELKIFGIEVVAIEPGFIKTPMFEKESPLSQQLGYEKLPIGPLWSAFLLACSKFQQKAKDVQVVCNAVHKAMTKKTPKTRYPLDPIWQIGRLLSDRQFDSFIFKAT